MNIIPKTENDKKETKAANRYFFIINKGNKLRIV